MGRGSQGIKEGRMEVDAEVDGKEEWRWLRK